MHSLNIKLLGSPSFSLNDSPLDLDHRKPLALFSYLVVTGQSHTRESLATLLWPDFPRARTYLRNNLWIIRRSLGQVDVNFLYITREAVAIQPNAPLWLDVAQFRHKVLTHLENAVQNEESVAHLVEAVDLYRGDFLTGFTLRDSPAFDEWCFFQREELRRLLSRALDTVVAHYLKRADFSTALPFAQQRVRHEPTDEAAQRQLMRLYVWDGQPQAALRQFQECVRVLRQELDVTPVAKTQELYAHIKADQLAQPPAESSPSYREFRAPSQLQPPTNLQTQHRLYAYDQIGRTHILEEIQQLLRQKEIQLLTLSGPGGVGKTSLAYAIFANQPAHFLDGCYWIELATIREPDLVLSGIAQALNMGKAHQDSVQTQLIEYLRAKSVLLILDNFEHVIAAAPLVAELVAHCPRLKVVVTSREVLRLRCEHKYVVPPLAVPDVQDSTAMDPDTIAQVSQYPAVQLFIKRIQQIRRPFVLDAQNAAAIVALCQRLDGLPLAIELAAAQCKLFTPQALLYKLNETTASSLSLLRNGPRDLDPRHQTLSGTIAWSYELLEVAEQQLFCALSYFVGSFTVEAAMAVYDEQATVLEHISALVDKSLIRAHTQPDGTPRFVMLETLREFGLAKLHQLGELKTVAQCHARYYVELSTTMQPQLRGPQSAEVARRFRLEYDNVRIAFRWLLTQKRVDSCLRLSHVLLDYWILGTYREAAAYIDETLAQAHGHPPSADYVNALVSAGFIARALADYQAAHAYFERALEMEALLQQQGAMGGDVVKVNTAMGLLAWAGFRRGEYAAALQGIEKACAHARQAGHIWSVAMSLENMGSMYMKLGKYKQSESALLEALQLKREVGREQGEASTLMRLGDLYVQQGRLAEATQVLAESLKPTKELGNERGIANVNLMYARLAVAQADFERANTKLHAALRTYRELDLPIDIEYVFPLCMQIALASGHPERVITLGTMVIQHHRKNGTQATPHKQQLFDQLFESACQQLDAETVSAARRTGETLTPDAAVAYALQESATT